MRLLHTSCVVAVTYVVASAAGRTLASIPDSNGVYTACALKGIYTIRLIDVADPKQKCTNLEVTKTWSPLRHGCQSDVRAP